METLKPKDRCMQALRSAVYSGAVAGIVSTIALAVCSKYEEGSAAGAINGPSQWLWGEREAHMRRTTVRHTAVGYGIHHLTSVGWATLHEYSFGRPSKPRGLLRHCVEAAVTAATAYVVDYHLAPARLRPGFKKHLGPVGIFAAYAPFAAGLALGAHGTAKRRENLL